MLSISANSVNPNDASGTLVASLQRHRKNVSKLSSGSRITDISDDSAGFAVAFTLNNTSLRSKNVASNISSGLSYLEHQADGIRKISDLVSRMSELTTRMMDPTLEQSDALGSPQSDILRELNRMRSELWTTLQEKLGDQNLFSTDGIDHSLNIVTSADGQSQITIAPQPFAMITDVATGLSTGVNQWLTLLGNFPPLDQPDGDGSTNTMGTPSVTDQPSTLIDSASWGTINFTGLLEEVSRMIADNGSMQTRLRNALESLNTNDHHLNDANSRIHDVDVAREVSHMARNQLLIDASASAMAQSNVTSAAVLKIITG